MNPVNNPVSGKDNSIKTARRDRKWPEIKEHGLFGRQLEPVLKAHKGKWMALTGVGVPGVTFYWMLTYSGPYRYFAELQLKWLGFYVPKLTVLVIIAGLVIGLFGLAAVITALFRGAERPVPGIATANVTTPAIAHKATAAPVTQTMGQWLLNIRLATAGIGAILILGIGANTYYNATQEGNLQELSAQDFQSGKVQARLVYADVRGHLGETYLKSENYLYVPMANQKNASAPIRLIVGVDEQDVQKLRREADGTVIVRGVADMGLKGDIRYAFEKSGVTVADSVWVMHTGRDPSSDRTAGLAVMGLGVAVGVFVWGWRRYQKRKRPAPQAVQAIA